jgi:hypothetical protein
MAVLNPSSIQKRAVVNGRAIPGDGIPKGLAHQMHALLKKADGKSIDLKTVISVISGRSHAVPIVFLSFPLCLPVGIPVLSTTLGLTLGLVGFLLAIGRDLWIPKFIGAKVIPYNRLSFVIERLLRVSARLDRWFHPRMAFVITNSANIRVHGFFVMFLGLVASIPLPLPFNNFVGAFPVLLLGLSLLEEDGLLAIVSYIAAIPCLIYYGALLYLGKAAFERLVGF